MGSAMTCKYVNTLSDFQRPIILRRFTSFFAHTSAITPVARKERAETLDGTRPQVGQCRTTQEEFREHVCGDDKLVAVLVEGADQSVGVRIVVMEVYNFLCNRNSWGRDRVPGGVLANLLVVMTIFLGGERQMNVGGSTKG